MKFQLSATTVTLVAAVLLISAASSSMTIVVASTDQKRRRTIRGYHRNQQQLQQNNPQGRHVYFEDKASPAYKKPSKPPATVQEEEVLPANAKNTFNAANIYFESKASPAYGTSTDAPTEEEEEGTSDTSREASLGNGYGNVYYEKKASPAYSKAPVEIMTTQKTTTMTKQPTVLKSSAPSPVPEDDEATSAKTHSPSSSKRTTVNTKKPSSSATKSPVAVVRRSKSPSFASAAFASAVPLPDNNDVTKAPGVKLTKKMPKVPKKVIRRKRGKASEAPSPPTIASPSVAPSLAPTVTAQTGEPIETSTLRPTAMTKDPTTSERTYIYINQMPTTIAKKAKANFLFHLIFWVMMHATNTCLSSQHFHFASCYVFFHLYYYYYYYHYYYHDIIISDRQTYR